MTSSIPSSAGTSASGKRKRTTHSTSTSQPITTTTTHSSSNPRNTRKRAAKSGIPDTTDHINVQDLENVDIINNNNSNSTHTTPRAGVPKLDQPTTITTNNPKQHRLQTETPGSLHLKDTYDAIDTYNNPHPHPHLQQQPIPPPTVIKQPLFLDTDADLDNDNDTINDDANCLIDNDGFKTPFAPQKLAFRTTSNKPRSATSRQHTSTTLPLPLPLPPHPVALPPPTNNNNQPPTSTTKGPIWSPWMQSSDPNPNMIGITPGGVAAKLRNLNGEPVNLDGLDSMGLGSLMSPLFGNGITTTTNMNVNITGLPIVLNHEDTDTDIAPQMTTHPPEIELEEQRQVLRHRRDDSIEPVYHDKEDDNRGDRSPSRSAKIVLSLEEPKRRTRASSTTTTTTTKRRQTMTDLPTTMNRGRQRTRLSEPPNIIKKRSRSRSLTPELDIDTMLKPVSQPKTRGSKPRKRRSLKRSSGVVVLRKEDTEVDGGLGRLFDDDVIEPEPEHEVQLEPEREPEPVEETKPTKLRPVTHAFMKLVTAKPVQEEEDIVSDDMKELLSPLPVGCDGGFVGDVIVERDLDLDVDVDVEEVGESVPFDDAGIRNEEMEMEHKEMDEDPTQHTLQLGNSSLERAILHLDETLHPPISSSQPSQENNEMVLVADTAVDAYLLMNESGTAVTKHDDIIDDLFSSQGLRKELDTNVNTNVEEEIDDLGFEMLVDVERTKVSVNNEEEEEVLPTQESDDQPSPTKSSKDLFAPTSPVNDIDEEDEMITIVNDAKPATSTATPKLEAATEAVLDDIVKMLCPDSSSSTGKPEQEQEQDPKPDHPTTPNTSKTEFFLTDTDDYLPTQALLNMPLPKLDKEDSKDREIDEEDDAFGMEWNTQALESIHFATQIAGGVSKPLPVPVSKPVPVIINPAQTEFDQTVFTTLPLDAMIQLTNDNGGFTLSNIKTLEMPSEESLRKAMEFGGKKKGRGVLGTATLKGMRDGVLKRGEKIVETEVVEKENEKEEEEPEKPEEFMGFRTGNNKPVAPPKQSSLDAAKKLFSTVEEVVVENNPDTNDIKEITTPPKFEGFKKANNKPAPDVKPESLEAARRLFRDVGDNDDGMDVDEPEPEPEPAPVAFQGFRTGNNKSVAKPSAKALAKAQALFADKNPELPPVDEFKEPLPLPATRKTTDAVTRSLPTGLRSLSDRRVSNGQGFKPHQFKPPTSAPVTPSMAGRRRNTQFKPLVVAPPITPASVVANVVDTKVGGQSEEVKKKSYGVFDLEVRGYRLSLSQLNPVAKNINLPPEVISMNPLVAKTFHFTTSTGTWGVSEARAELLLSGAESKHATPEYVQNHYEHIIWKLASMIRRCPSLLPEYWRPRKIVEQLRYRYEREVNQAQRSALRLVCEKDDSPARFMVLVVMEIVEGELVLSDGWYRMRAVLDEPLKNAVVNGRVFVGLKLAIYGAELTGNTEPKPPLEIGESTKLKLCANSVRRAKWDAKLGYQLQPGFTVALRSLYRDGGTVPCVDVIISRVYPMTYMETMEDGTKIFRNAREEQIAQREFDKRISSRMEQYLEEARHDVQKRTTRSSTRGKQVDVALLSDIDDLFDAYENAPDSADFMRSLSIQQSQKLQTYLEQRMVEKQTKLQKVISAKFEESNGTRNVTPLIKIRVCDYPQDGKRRLMESQAVLTIWRPDDNLLAMLGEGTRVKIFNLVASRKDHGTGGHTDMISLTSGRNTKYMPIESDLVVMEQSIYVPRSIRGCNMLQDVAKGQEVDLFGFVVAFGPAKTDTSPNGRTFTQQQVFLSDTSGSLVVIETHSRNQTPLWASAAKPLDIVYIRNATVKFVDYRDHMVSVRSTDDTEIKVSPRGKELLERKADLQKWITDNAETIEYLQTQSNNIVNNLPVVPNPRLQAIAPAAEATEDVDPADMNLTDEDLLFNSQPLRASDYQYYSFVPENATAPVPERLDKLSCILPFSGHPHRSDGLVYLTAVIDVEEFSETALKFNECVGIVVTIDNGYSRLSNVRISLKALQAALKKTVLDEKLRQSLSEKIGSLWNLDLATTESCASSLQDVRARVFAKVEAEAGESMEVDGEEEGDDIAAKWIQFITRSLVSGIVVGNAQQDEQVVKKWIEEWVSNDTARGDCVPFDEVEWRVLIEIVSELFGAMDLSTAVVSNSKLPNLQYEFELSQF